MIAEGLKNWIEECPYIQVVDISTVKRDGNGLYKQAAVEIEECIDGSEIRIENWYILVQRSNQLPSERLNAEETMENFENWIFEQNLEENYPDIGYAVCSVGISNGYVLMDTENDEAVYQGTLQVEYIKEKTK